MKAEELHISSLIEHVKSDKSADININAVECAE